ncbi:uncharacterized protein LOC141641196 [Silene latifolia]|uniref:uncharacterized protein LOC141641196 n=1 Tax=Silene latifolia TaxID=37657 RepID=UPI003D778C69
MTLRKIRICLRTFKIKNNKGIGKYLGMPTEFQGSKKEIFKGLLDNVTKRVSSWNGVLLSPAERLTLISSVLSNISNYFLSVFKIPELDLGNRSIGVAGCLPACLRGKVDLGSTANSGGWNQQFIRLLFDEETTNRILAIHVRPNQVEDDSIWSFTKTGEYSVKSGYGILCNDLFASKASALDKSRMNVKRKDFCRTRLWHLPGPQSWKILVWKILSNSLPVGVEFEKRHLSWESSCCLCHTFVESIDHIFKDCEVAARIWAGSSLGVNTGHAGSISTGDWIINWIHYLRTLDDWEVPTIQFLATIVSIWNLRNAARFRGGKFYPEVFFRFLNQLVGVTMEARTQSSRSLGQGSTEAHNDGIMEQDLGMNTLGNGNPVYVTGTPGSCSMIRLMVDASWRKSCEASWGWIALDMGGHVVGEGNGRGFAESPLQVEALGVTRAISWARDCGLLHVEVSSDCLQLLGQWAGYGAGHYLIAGILDDIAFLSTNFHCLCFSYVCRELNGPAHRLARRAMTMA